MPTVCAVPVQAVSTMDQNEPLSVKFIVCVLDWGPCPLSIVGLCLGSGLYYGCVRVPASASISRAHAFGLQMFYVRLTVSGSSWLAR